MAGVLAAALALAGCSGGADDGGGGGEVTPAALVNCLDGEGIAAGEVADAGALGTTAEVALPMGGDTRDDIWVEFFESTDAAEQFVAAQRVTSNAIRPVTPTISLLFVQGWADDAVLQTVTTCIKAE